MHREDRGHAGEAERDKERAIVAHAERGARDQGGHQRSDDGYVRGDDEVLEPDDDWLVARWIAQIPREEDRGQERRDHDDKRPNGRRPHAAMLVGV